jgi:hypothetical protein
MERYRRERSSLEVDPGGRYDCLPKQSIPTPVQPKRLPPRRYPQATHHQVEAELARSVETGPWEPTTCSRYVSRLLLVTKPGNNQWRFIVDLRHMNSFSVKKRPRMESLLGVRHLTRKGDYIFSFDLKDGFYALGIVPQQRDFLTLNVRSQMYRLAGLPMGWSLSPYHLCAFTDTFVRHLRQPDPGGFTTHQGRPTQPDGDRPSNASSDTRGGEEQKSYLTSTTSSSSPPPGLSL